MLLLAVGVMLFARNKPHESLALEGASRAGASDFEAYKSKVEVEIGEDGKVVYDNMIGMFQIGVRAKIHNRGDRAITGLEIVGKMLSLEDKVLSQRISIPIPNGRTEPLKPGETMSVSLKVDAPNKITEADVKDVILEVQALKFQ